MRVTRPQRSGFRGLLAHRTAEGFLVGGDREWECAADETDVGALVRGLDRHDDPLVWRVRRNVALARVGCEAVLFLHFGDDPFVQASLFWVRGEQVVDDPGGVAVERRTFAPIAFGPIAISSPRRCGDMLASA